MRPSTRRRTKLIIGIAAFYTALWLLWWTPVVLPLKLFVVLLHELSHALAAIATGGTVERIVLNLNEGGATYTRGGNAFLMLSAGYLGSLLFGLLLIEVAGSLPRLARATLVVLGALLLITSGLFVRNPFGFVFTAAAGAVLFIAAWRFSARAVGVTLLMLGFTSALYALLDIRSDILQQPGAPSDAYMLAQLTGVPTLVWGVLWIGVAVLACWLALRRWLRRA